MFNAITYIRIIDSKMFRSIRDHYQGLYTWSLHQCKGLLVAATGSGEISDFYILAHTYYQCTQKTKHSVALENHRPMYLFPIKLKISPCITQVPFRDEVVWDTGQAPWSLDGGGWTDQTSRHSH